MNKFNKILKSIDSIEYISKPMEERDILLILKINGFTVERGGLLLDFVESIVQKITKTYLGDDLMSTEDKRKHFDWCWSSVLSCIRILVGFLRRLPVQSSLISIISALIAHLHPLVPLDPLHRKYSGVTQLMTVRQQNYFYGVLHFAVAVFEKF